MSRDSVILVLGGLFFFGYLLLLIFGAMPAVRSQGQKLGLETGWGLGIEDAHAGEKFAYDPTGIHTYKHQNPMFANEPQFGKIQP